MTGTKTDQPPPCATASASWCRPKIPPIQIQPPHGPSPLKCFFPAALSRNDGYENGSAAAVRHRIGQLVQAENPADPLSDEAITKIMADEGVELARRTVAKYRDLLHIPSSSQRRRQALVAGRA